MTFEEYCEKKKIDYSAFKKGDPLRHKEFSNIFPQVSPESFTQQKKFLINDIRRKFPLKETTEEKPKAAGASAKKPVIKAAPKIKKP